MSRRIMPILLLVLFAGAAHADSKFYYGLNFNSGELELEDGFALDTNGFGLKWGREFGRWLSVELHGGVSANDTSNLIRDPEISFGGAFVRFNLPFERVNVYVLGGASKVSVDAGTVATSFEEAAGGVGLDLFAGEDSALTLEVMRYGQDSSLDTLSIGFMHRFDFPRLR